MDSVLTVAYRKCLRAMTLMTISGILVIILFQGGCSVTEESPPVTSTEIEELNELCFGTSTDCEQLEADLVLYLDTGNLPSHNNGNGTLVLSSKPVHVVADGNDRLAFVFSGELPAEIDPGIEFENGWKAVITDADIYYCTTCYTNAGLAEVIFLRGGLEQVNFIYDPDDKIEVSIRTRPRIGI